MTMTLNQQNKFWTPTVYFNGFEIRKK